MAALGSTTMERWLTFPEYGPMPVATRSGLAPLTGIKLHVATCGAGSPMLLIHGGPGISTMNPLAGDPA